MAGSRANSSPVWFGCLLVLLIAGFNSFYRLGEPAHPIWDENYYVTSTARYHLGAAQFASHPPLGLMLIAAGDTLSGANRAVDWRPIANEKKIRGEDLPPQLSFYGLRCASALFGTLAAGLFYLLMVSIGAPISRALLLTTPFLFDTALLAQFRAAQLDSFQLFFTIAALIALVRSVRTRSIVWMLAFGVACGLATMVRANAALLSLAALVPALCCLRDGARRRVGRALALIGSAAAAFIFTCIAIFAIHFAVSRTPLPATSASARADSSFVEPAYGAMLQGERPASATIFIQSVDGYRRFMAADFSGIGLKDTNGSKPWTWPMGRGAIVYRWDSTGPETSYVALVPNLAAWIVSLLGVTGACVALAFGRRLQGLSQDDRILLATLAGCWIVFMLSDMMMAATRVMYLYHYFLPLTLGWAAFAVLLCRSALRARAGQVGAGLAVAILLNFLVTAPLALHHDITTGSCFWRAWPSGLHCDH